MIDSNALLRSAEELSKEFHLRSDEIEQTRRIAPEISEKIARAGFYRLGALDYTAEEVFVPNDRIAGYQKSDIAPSPLYAFPNFTFLALGIAAVCMGIARASINELVHLAATKKRVSSRKTVADQQISQMKLAQAEADLQSARLFYYNELEDAWQGALAGNEVSIEQRRNIRLATTNAVNKSVGLVNEMYDLGGGTSVYEKSNLQKTSLGANSPGGVLIPATM